MKNKKAIIIAAAVIAVIAAAAIIFAVVSNQSKDYKDEPVTIPVTDESGVTVTDKDGNTVTELSSASENDKDKDSSSSDKASDDKTNAGGKTSSANDKSSTSDKQEDEKDDTESEKPTSRRIKLNVKYPYRRGEKTTVKIEYKLSKDSDKKYKLLKEEELVMDNEKTVGYEIKDKLKGDVDVRITIKGVELVKNVFVVKANESEAAIALATGGIEELDGGMD